MATKKISALVSEGKILTAPDGDEYLYIYEPDGADDANKGLAVKLATLGITGGWVEVSGWSYASATTINVPSGAASIYAVGDQIRLKQGGAYKYFYVIAVADTLLTVTGGSDYSVANLPITNAAFSKGGGVEHPIWYNWTPIFNGTGGMTFTSITDIIARFTIVGGTCIGHLEAQGTIGGTPSSAIEVTSPTPIAYMGRFPVDGNPEGTWGWNMRLLKSGPATFLIQTSSYGNWAAGSGRWIRTNFNYIL